MSKYILQDNPVGGRVEEQAADFEVGLGRE
jgi:hypothetical protein